MELSDIFGGSIGGLLAPEDQQQLTNNALLNAGLGILAASAGGARRYAGMPNRPSLGQALLQGLQAGTGAYQTGAQNLLSGREYQEKMAQKKRQQELNAQLSPLLQGGDKYNAYMMAGNKAAEMGDIETATRYYDIAQKFKEKEPELKTEKIDNKIINLNTGKTIYEGQKEVKAPQTRTIENGRIKITQEFQPDGTWREIGRSSIDAPQQAQRPSYSTFTGADGQVYRFNSLTNVAEPVTIAGSGKPLTGPSATPKITADQQQNAGFAKRMAEAEKDLSTLTTSDQKAGMFESGIGMISETGANLTRDPNRQKALQAQREWVRAKLRKESGAAIGKDEMENEIRTYFPQIGDTQDVIQQKAKAREVATQTIIEGSGGAYVPFKPNLGAPILKPQDAVMGGGGWSIKKKGSK